MPVSTFPGNCAAKAALLSAANVTDENSVVGIVTFDNEGRMHVQAFGLDVAESIGLFKNAADLLKDQL